jgi:hypothetical protein
MTVPRFTTAVQKPANAVPTPRRQATTEFTMPAPMSMNTMTPVASQSPQDCIYTYNLMPYEIGMRTREGYKQHVQDLPEEGRTVLPFHGDVSDGSNDRLFVATEGGIYNCTTSATPTSVHTWATTGGLAGYLTWTHFDNDGDEHFLIAADEVNGMVEYEEATGLWSVITQGAGAGQIDNVDPADIFFVMAHKQRIWMIEKDSSAAWYLPTGQKAGAATRFNFGSQLREGGNLVGLYSWTVDGGDGVDDYMVALSREGGVAIYQGNDPANASTWALVGVWYIGRVPAGHRVASQYGGQLFLLSENGLISVNRLLQGQTVAEAAESMTSKITRVVREEIARTIDDRGWEIRSVPRESQYMINSPLTDQRVHLQYVMNTTTQGWGIWRDVPYSTGDVFQGELFFASKEQTVDGFSIWQMTGERDKDESTFNPGQNDKRGVPVAFSMLTSYQGTTQPGFKRGQFCRPYFLSAGIPSFSVQARWDYNLSENSKGISFVPGDVALWDSALWDSSLWVGGVDSTESIRGLTGFGHAIAIALRGETSSRLTLVAIEIQLDQGGLL